MTARFLDIACRWFGHDWMDTFEMRVCDCNMLCQGTFRVYSGSVCRRCRLWRDAA